jgi:hypothetical protein
MIPRVFSIAERRIKVSDGGDRNGSRQHVGNDVAGTMFDLKIVGLEA